MENTQIIISLKEYNKLLEIKNNFEEKLHLFESERNFKLAENVNYLIHKIQEHNKKSWFSKIDFIDDLPFNAW